MKFIRNIILTIFTIVSTTFSIDKCNMTSPKNCITFTIGPNTGCSWMFNYCANNLGTNNYYFTDNVCVYESGGCNGNPQLGVSYTCCSV